MRRSNSIPILMFCLLLCMVMSMVLKIGSNPSEYYPLLGYAFFIEPYFSELGRHVGFQLVPAMVFLVWMLTAAALTKVRRENRRFRLSFLVLLPPLSICAFNGLFDAGSSMPIVAPAAVLTLIGVVIYEIAYAEGWARIMTCIASAVLCISYGLHTGLGLWGSIVASFAMVLVQLAWSSVEMQVFSLTSPFYNRKFQYR
ncbi:MAG TPA: hypothetical protein VM141_12205 [Planctomycetota bacterium]|nr:hypothetical protein [Planctomycetota bacterium]